MKIEELAYHKTSLGELILRRRQEPLLQNREVFEVKLGDDFLMSSLFTEAEKELANLGLAGLSGDLDVVVGGLPASATARYELKQVAMQLQHEIRRERHARAIRVDGVQNVAGIPRFPVRSGSLVRCAWQPGRGCAAEGPRRPRCGSRTQCFE